MAADRQRVAALGKIDPHAGDQLETFAEAKAHRSVIARIVSFVLIVPSRAKIGSGEQARWAGRPRDVRPAQSEMGNAAVA